MKLDGLDHVALAVSDIQRSAQWYMDVLGLEREHANVWGDIPTFVVVHGTGLALFPKKASEQGTPDRGFRHVAFRASRQQFVTAQRELKSRGIAFEFQDHEIAHSIYFSDPDGHTIEITTYELE